jgi:L-rhamnose mutarotase
VLFDAATLAGLTAGSVTCTYRRWTVVRPRVGSTFTTRAGVVEVTSIEPVTAQALTDDDARAAGFRSLSALTSWTSAKGAGDLYRIGIALRGPDPRIALRGAADLGAAELKELDTRLGRMDRAAPEPWTVDTLTQIERRPGVVSTELAAEVDQPRQFYKVRVRRLKALGLTESLEVGYRLSPRGAAYLRHRRPRPEESPVQRMAQIIQVRPEQVERYVEVHRAVWPEVLATIAACNIRNYSIFLRQPENLLFAYFEYHGTDFAADSARMAADPKTQEWWEITAPMQQQLASATGADWWSGADEVFHVD